MTFLLRNIYIDFLTFCEIWPNKTEKKMSVGGYLALLIKTKQTRF